MTSHSGRNPEPYSALPAPPLQKPFPLVQAQHQSRALGSGTFAPASGTCTAHQHGTLSRQGRRAKLGRAGAGRGTAATLTFSWISPSAWGCTQRQGGPLATKRPSCWERERPLLLESGTRGIVYFKLPGAREWQQRASIWLP